MKIDLKKLEGECPQGELLSSFVPRRIITEFIKERNKNQLFTKVVVGLEIEIYLMDTSGYMFRDIAIEWSNINILEEVGKIMGVSVYRDNTYQIKSDEFFLFDNEDNLPFTKQYLRGKKLERILNGK